MDLLRQHERGFLQVVANLVSCNPFLPERIAYEREALGADFSESDPVWSLQVDRPDLPSANPQRIAERVDVLVEQLRERLAQGARPSPGDLALYQDAVQYWLFYRYYETLLAAAGPGRAEAPAAGRFAFYADFLRDWKRCFAFPDLDLPQADRAPHMFAVLFQVARGFHNIFEHIVGGSLAAARLRAAVWQSMFTHDLRRYRDALYDRMGDVSTLITGPSGTGKELVARAIGLSRYIPFDAGKRTFATDAAGSFQALNLSALSPTLIESELFGHKRGAFTGAVEDRRGWLEVCRPGGAVFLDEIGDVDIQIQVKLLRVLETRTFQAVGDTAERRFHGKIIAATNRDLAAAMHDGRFREDLYYRLCSDIITTPSLQDQLRESPGVLPELLLFIARNVAGPGAEALAEEAETWIARELGDDYDWPGNIRELEQCVRSVLIRKGYRPVNVQPPQAREALAAAVREGALTADELLSRYCTLVYAQTANYQEAARRLQLDRRTVRAKIDPQFLAQL